MNENPHEQARTAGRLPFTPFSTSGYGPRPPDGPGLGLGSLAEIVSMVPHQMGFHPRDSLVVILVDGHGRWIATARRDWSPSASAVALAGWVGDVAAEGAGVMLGLYGEAEAARRTVSGLGALEPRVVAGYVVGEGAWFALATDGSWDERPLEEIWSAPAQLEAWGAGSAPAARPAAHGLGEPSALFRSLWEEAAAEISAELATMAKAARAGRGAGAPGAFPEAVRRGLCAWGFVMDRVGERDDVEEWDEWERQELVLAAHALGVRAVRDTLLLVSASGDAAATPGAVMLGEWEGPVDARGLLSLEVLLEAVGPLVPRGLRAEALCLLAWIEWARGHGSVAGATVAAALELVPEHELGRLLARFLDTGTLPRWLRPSKGGLGGDWGGMAGDPGRR